MSTRKRWTQDTSVVVGPYEAVRPTQAKERDGKQVEMRNSEQQHWDREEAEEKRDTRMFHTVVEDHQLNVTHHKGNFPDDPTRIYCQVSPPLSTSVPSSSFRSEPYPKAVLPSIRSYLIEQSTGAQWSLQPHVLLKNQNPRSTI